MHKVADKVYVESNAHGVTVGAIVTGQGVVAVDTPTRPADAHKWRARLEQLSHHKPLLAVINLDHHRDRIVSGTFFDAPAVAHEIAADRIRATPELLRVPAPEIGADAEQANEPLAPRLALPQFSFSQELVLHKGGVDIIVEHHGGNTPGAAWVHLPKAKVLFVGDLLTLNAPPFLAEADFERWLSLLDQLKKARYRGYTLVPGRGPATDASSVPDFVRYLNAVLRKVGKFHASGRPRTDLPVLVPPLLAEFEPPGAMRELYARRIRHGLENVYDQVEREAKTRQTARARKKTAARKKKK